MDVRRCQGFAGQKRRPQGIEPGHPAGRTGGTFLPQDLALKLLQERAASGEKVGGSLVDLAALSPREMEVLTLLCEGHSNKEIAQTLYLSVRTVEGHLLNLCRKLGVHTRTGAALLALGQGLIHRTR